MNYKIEFDNQKMNLVLDALRFTADKSNKDEEAEYVQLLKLCEIQLDKQNFEYKF